MTNENINFSTIDRREQTPIQTLFAQAVWNQEEGCWNVLLNLTESGECSLDGVYTTSTRMGVVKVSDCDEFAIADALLDFNGIDLKKLYNSNQDFILEKYITNP